MLGDEIAEELAAVEQALARVQLEYWVAYGKGDAPNVHRLLVESEVLEARSAVLTRRLREAATIMSPLHSFAMAVGEIAESVPAALTPAKVGIDIRLDLFERQAMRDHPQPGSVVRRLRDHRYMGLRSIDHKSHTAECGWFDAGKLTVAVFPLDELRPVYALGSDDALWIEAQRATSA